MDRRLGSVAMSCLAGLGVVFLLIVVLVAGQGAAVGGPAVSLFASDRVPQPRPQPGAMDAISFDSWITRTAMPAGRALAGSAVLSETILVIGGWHDGAALTVTEAYVPTTDSWLSRAGMQHERNALAAAALGGKVYAMGGWSSSAMTVTAAVEVYDPVFDQWTSASPLPLARNGLVAAAVNGEIYAIGGWDGRAVTDSVTAYNPLSGTWRACAPMPTARNGLAAVAVGDRIYAIGGFDGSAVTGKVEIYDPAADSWSAGADMPTARWLVGAGAIDGRIYVMGGNEDGSFGSPLAANEAYDPAADAWRTAAPMPTARWGPAVAAVDGRMYAIGGSGEDAIHEAYRPPAPYQVYLPAVLRDFDGAPVVVSQARFQVFILNPVRTCLVGNDFASGSVCRGPNCGDCDCTWEQFDPLAPLVGVSPERVNDPQYAGYTYRECVTITLSAQEVAEIVADMELVREQVLAWSGGALDLQITYTVLPHDHVGFVAPDFVFGPFEVDDELLNPYVTTATDFVYVVSGVHDRSQGLHLAYACGGSYGEMSVHGAGYANIQYNDLCNAI